MTKLKEFLSLLFKKIYPRRRPIETLKNLLLWNHWFFADICFAWRKNAQPCRTKWRRVIDFSFTIFVSPSLLLPPDYRGWKRYHTNRFYCGRAICL